MFILHYSDTQCTAVLYSDCSLQMGQIGAKMKKVTKYIICSNLSGKLVHSTMHIRVCKVYVCHILFIPSLPLPVKTSKRLVGSPPVNHEKVCVCHVFAYSHPTPSPRLVGTPHDRE